MENRSPEKEGADYFSRREAAPSQQTPRPRRLQSDRIASIQTPGSPTSPRTPRTPGLGRSLSGNWGSPGLSFRQDDDYLVFEFSHRYLRAGLGGEREPRCQLSCTPEFQRRAGDYGPWLAPDSSKARRSLGNTLDDWAEGFEFWQMDLRNVDLALVGDKIERALREAIRDHVLVLDDSKKRKAMLVVPPIMPHPLLSLLCTKIFALYPPPPSVTLLPSPTMCTVSAGLRSALVVDLGWATTTVSAVYEYREVKHTSSTRSVKLLCWKMKETLETRLNAAAGEGQIPLIIEFADAEEVVNKVAWCPRDENREDSVDGDEGSRIAIPLGSGSSAISIEVPFRQLAQPVEQVFLQSTGPDAADDDHEIAIPGLIFKALLNLPIDVRQTCLHRIIFTGGGSGIPGLKSRILADLMRMISRRGWDPVINYGSAKAPPKWKTMQRPDGPVARESPDIQPTQHANKDIDPESTAPPHLQTPLPDPVLSRLTLRAAARPVRQDSDPSLTSESEQPTETEAIIESREPAQIASSIDGGRQLRSVVSLGSWTGASLLTGLRVPGLVEIERERFLQHGLHGGQAVDEKRRSNQQTQRQSLLGALGPGRPIEPTAWTLGIWA